MDATVIGGIIRHVLTALAGVLVTKGIVEAGQAEIIIGSLTGLAGVVWSIWQKKKA